MNLSFNLQKAIKPEKRKDVQAFFKDVKFRTGSNAPLNYEDCLVFFYSEAFDEGVTAAVRAIQAFLQEHGIFLDLQDFRPGDL